MGNKRCKLCQKVGTKGFFGFPTNKKGMAATRGKWLEICELPAETETGKLYICFRHFQANNIEECSNFFRVIPGKFLLLFSKYCASGLNSSFWFVHYAF